MKWPNMFIQSPNNTWVFFASFCKSLNSARNDKMLTNFLCKWIKKYTHTASDDFLQDQSRELFRKKSSCYVFRSSVLNKMQTIFAIISKWKHILISKMLFLRKIPVRFIVHIYRSWRLKMFAFFLLLKFWKSCSFIRHWLLCVHVTTCCCCCKKASIFMIQSLRYKPAKMSNDE